MTARQYVLAGITALVAMLAPSPAVPAWAHPGHGTMALAGTLAVVAAEAVTLDVRDVASGVVTRVRVGTGTDTKLSSVIAGATNVSMLTTWVPVSVIDGAALSTVSLRYRAKNWVTGEREG